MQDDAKSTRHQNMDDSGPTRRDLIKTAAAGALLSIWPVGGQQFSVCADQPVAGLKRPEAFRFVHFTDIHVQLERDGDKGLAKALRTAESLRPKPEFILTGGDLVFDAFEQSSKRSEELFKLFNKVVSDNTSLHIYPCIGNHDVFGWKSSGVGPQTPGYGKQMAKDQLKFAETNYHFDHKGWRFFVLDNVLPADNKHGYRGGLSPEGLEWFSKELRGTPADQPVIICEHIPLITVTGFGWEDAERNGSWQFDDNLICADSADRLKLIRERNVRLCLSGHIHERDRIQYFDTTFINDGAVCGGWWKGPHRGVEEGFGVIDAKADGTFDYQYVDYGWKASSTS